MLFAQCGCALTHLQEKMDVAIALECMYANLSQHNKRSHDML